MVRWPGKIEAGSSSDQMLCLTDIFATCAEVVSGDPLPGSVAEDSYSFLSSLVGSDPSKRTSLVSHSVSGEFAYRNGPWKIVFKLPEDRLISSRGKPAIVELYNLSEDISEQNNLAEERPELVTQFTRELETVVQRGTSRMGPPQLNDVKISFDTIQTERWAPTIHN
jgi:arylsulfatase A